MPNANKRRSYRQETQIAEFWEDRGFEAERAFASRGESLVNSNGERLTEDVDNIIYKALPSKDLLIQAKSRKNGLGGYLLPDGMRDAVFLSTQDDKPDLYVFPDYVFAEMLEGNPRLFLHLDVVDRSKKVAGYVFPPEGADVTAMRQNNDTTNYYAVPQRLFHRIKTNCLPEEKKVDVDPNPLEGLEELKHFYEEMARMYKELAKSFEK